MFTNIYKPVEQFFLYSWWIILFTICCYLAYEQGLVKRDKDFDKLHAQYIELQKENKRSLALQEKLLLQVNSQSDVEWVELTLMKGLGLVPDGQTKVVFTHPENK
ncbi:MAG: hypothetical protein H0X29_04065 [Parachlamydiaceae bacterium]|nr:hypothetical protein [Parachlamydiaceae bacterium]